MKANSLDLQFMKEAEAEARQGFVGRGNSDWVDSSSRKFDRWARS